MEKEFQLWEKIKDITYQYLDFTLNYRQSGHPGGSHSKAHMLIALLFGKKMTYDIRKPEYRFNDRLILSAGHTIPIIYSLFAVIGDAFDEMYRQTKDAKYLIDEDKLVRYYDLLTFRHNKGLPGHAESSGKTLLLKFNTGPSAHGLPASVGQALALKKAGLQDVKVFLIEGEGALTAGATHESQNGAWAYGLGNLFWLLDWNDFGIDDRPFSSVVYGTPDEWFSAHGWKVHGTMNGHSWQDVYNTIKKAVEEANDNIPNLMWFKTKKGYGYGVYDNKSHGVPHKKNSEIFWETRKPFMEKYGVEFIGFGKPAPFDPYEERKQWEENLKIINRVLTSDEKLLKYITDTLVEIAEALPKDAPSTFVLNQNPYKDPAIYDYKNYPDWLFAKPGENVPNRAALAKWGMYINGVIGRKYGRPLFVATSADLTESTNLHGFGLGKDDFAGFGVYDREKNVNGAILPSAITEFLNAGVCAGLATVNLSENPYEDFNGFWAITSTYGSFMYLKYGAIRLFSQMAQDSPIKFGKVIWVAGHSGPETAEDSRTHFGIFEPGVLQLLPKGKIINLYPWEHNEVPVLLAAALATDINNIALHLTRPPIEIPDRNALGIPSHFEAAKGAYIINDFDPNRRKDGTIIVRGTSTTYNLIKLLPQLRKDFNLKIIAAPSFELFMMQKEKYRNKVLPLEDWMDSMVITNESKKLMHDWIFSKVSEEYSLSSDWDNQWRTGGTVDEILKEAHLDCDSIYSGIEKFVKDREKRIAKLKSIL